MKLYYDLLIWTVILAEILPAFFLLYNKKKIKNCWEQRHPKWTNLFASILIFGALCVFYGSYIEPHLLVTNRQTIDIENLDHEIKIAFIADFQVGPYKKESHLEKVVEHIERLNPDIVMIGGDQIMNDGSSLEEYKYLSPLGKLAKEYPTYAIHGNHEYGVGRKSVEANWTWLPNLHNEVRETMENLGIIYLANDLKLLNINGEQIYLFGGDSFLARKLDLSILDTRKEEIPTIALIHHPLTITQLVGKNVDILFSGHTHGGQIRVPFIGPLGKIETKIPTKWYQGLSEFENIKLFVSSGTGETGARTRFLNPPEVALITLK
jgi:hypothetical protein